MHITTREATERFPIPELAERLALPPLRIGSNRSPFREDRNPSFSIFDGGKRWIDHATGDGGNAVDFIVHARDLDRTDACHLLRQLAGDDLRFHPVLRSPNPKRQLPTLPNVAAGTHSQRQAFARTRHLDIGAIHLAADLGTARFGVVAGKPSIILTDASGRCAEARTLDGSLYPDDRDGHKSHTIAGSSKAWPVGISPPYFGSLEGFSSILIVEGTPDYFAALHFALTLGNFNVLPVAMLGRNCDIAPETLPRFAGKHVRIYPHADPDGGGLAAANRWAIQLNGIASKLDFFDFAGLQKSDGDPINDLNDLVHITPTQTASLTELLP